MWKRLLFGVLLVFAGRSSALSYVGSVEVIPPRPTAADEVTVRVSGDLPDPCWTFMGSAVDRAGKKIMITVDMRQVLGIACPQVLVPYEFKEPLGRLEPGFYELTVTDAQGSMSADFVVTGENALLPERFTRGDSNSDGTVDVSDAIATLGALFTGGPPLGCEDAADANDDGALDVSDAVFTLLALFAGGEPFPRPGRRACGVDPTPDGLGCASFSPCGPSAGEVYLLTDNRMVCFTTPCFHLTALDNGGLETQVSDLDLTPLGLSPEKQNEFLDRLAKGPENVIGYLIPGPEGPAGLGTTLVVLEDLGPG